jgi:hypothetical protein
MMRTLRDELHQADDQKIRQVTAILDEVSNATGKQAILDPLRGRLGSLKPVRPLRFVRLLFMPLDPVIVPASEWRPGDATVPRTVLTVISRLVRAGMAAEASVIDTMIAGHKADALQIITEAGDVLWPRAAEILAVSPVPVDWPDTGLRPALFPPLAAAIAAVLRRASRLRHLSRDGDVGVLEADRRIIEEILQVSADEAPDGLAMIAQLILLQSPWAASVLRQIASARLNAAERSVWQQGLVRGTERVLVQMERPSGLIDEIEHAPLRDVGDHVRRMAELMHAIEDDTGAHVHRPRLKAIRDRLDAACRVRFAEGIEAGLVAPLTTASGAMDGAGQTDMERCARDLRTFETVARKMGGAVTYDQLLDRAAESVQAAAAAGTLTPIRKFCLVEILSGSDVATAMYKAAMALSRTRRP